MRDRIATMTLSTVITAVLVTGCSGSQGSPQPAPSGSSASATSSPSSGGAPHVAKPLDTTKFQADPCSVLSVAEAAPFGLSEAAPEKSDALGPKCSWYNRPTLTSVIARFVTANKDGLGSLYRQRDSLELFHELPSIQGYPAVIWGQIDSRSSGGCDVSVGVSDNLDFNVAVQSSNGPLKADPCGAAQRIATIVLGHLRGGS